MAPKNKFTREEFTAASMKIVRTRGFAALTAKAIADELHISTRPVFTCFNTMDEVKKEVYLAAERIYQEYEAEGLKAAIPFLGVGMQYIRFAKDEPELYKLLFLMSESDGIGGAMKAMEHLQDMVRDSLMTIYRLDSGTADFYFRDMWLVAHSLATLVVTGDCPYSEEQIGNILTGFSVSLYKAIKEIPDFTSGAFDRDMVFENLIQR